MVFRIYQALQETVDGKLLRFKLHKLRNCIGGVIVCQAVDMEVYGAQTPLEDPVVA